MIFQGEIAVCALPLESFLSKYSAGLRGENESNKQPVCSGKTAERSFARNPV